MKIEYFRDVDRQGLVLVYGNEPENVIVLRDAVRDLAEKKVKRLAVHELPGFEGVDECQLFFSVEPSDHGTWLASVPRTFECCVRPAWWENVGGLLEPFCEPGPVGGFHYLDYGFESDIQLVISRDRHW